MLRQFLCLAAFAAVSVLGQIEVHPCNGLATGFARDIRSCPHFWRCAVNPPTRGECPNGNLFDAEAQRCVLPRNGRCFRCPDDVAYELRSVPGVCHQYTRCFRGQASLHACQNRLWFDGRAEIRNCNHRPASGQCHRESEEETENIGQCPNVQFTRPLYFRARNSCTRFFVCAESNVSPLSNECRDGLHFDIRTGDCNLPEHAGCENVQTPRPPTGGDGRGPAIDCPVARPALIPDRVDCQRYWICPRVGVPQVDWCGQNLIFDDISRQCTRREQGRRCWAEHNGTIRPAVFSFGNATATEPESDEISNANESWQIDGGDEAVAIGAELEQPLY